MCGWTRCYWFLLDEVVFPVLFLFFLSHYAGIGLWGIHGSLNLCKVCCYPFHFYCLKNTSTSLEHSLVVPLAH